MNKKRGVSLIILAIAIAIMGILISTATVIGSKSITTANFDEYTSILMRVYDNINIYYLENNELPVTGEIVIASSISMDFFNNVKEKGDEFNKLQVVNVSLLNNKNIKKGRGTVKNNDVFLVAENTHNVYYLKGFKYQGKVVYGI